MANSCRTIYICEGTREQISDLNNVLTLLSDMEEPYVENGWGHLWLGCLIEYLGGKWEEHACRGEIVGFEVDEEDGTTIEIVQETAWREQSEVRHFLEHCYPGMKIYWQDEEPGCDWYATNDDEGRYFTDRYYLDCYEIGDPDYFADLPSIIKAVEEMIKHPIELSSDTTPDMAINIIQEAINDYMKDNCSDNAYANISCFSIIND